MPSIFPVESRGFSATQLAKIQELKLQLQRAGQWDASKFDEHDLARFLKARSYDVHAARVMWEHMLAWRKEHRVDTIHDWFVFHERREYDRIYPTGLHKTDKKGHPVLVQKLGKVNVGALYKLTNDERLRLAHIAECEHMRKSVFPACSRHAGRHIDQLFTIIDLEGIAFTSVMRTTSMLKAFMQMDSNNYPETLHHMAIINAPGWFSTSWSAVKSVLSGDTVKKIEILGTQYRDTLLQHIAPENLLVEYGGKSVGQVTDHIGPWSYEEPEPVPCSPASIPMEVEVELMGPPSLPLPAGRTGYISGVPPAQAHAQLQQRAQGAAGGQAAAAAMRPLHQPQPARLPSDLPSPTASSSTASSDLHNMTAPLLSNFHPTSSQGCLDTMAYEVPSPVMPAVPAATPPQQLRSSGGGAGPPAPSSDIPTLAAPGGGKEVSSSQRPASGASASWMSARHMHGRVAPPQLDVSAFRTSLVAAASGDTDTITLMSASSNATMASAMSATPSLNQPRGLSPMRGGLPAAAAGPAPVPMEVSSTEASSPMTTMASLSTSSLPLTASVPVPVAQVRTSTTGPGFEPQVSGASVTQQQQGMDDDVESVRMSVMSQRSFYSALSHLEYSSTHSGITSPASDQSRRWSMQRELHAVAIAQAVAATAEQRRLAAAAATPVAAVSGPSLTYGGHNLNPPPAAQQAFGSWLDQPPRYDVQANGNGHHSPNVARMSAGPARAHGQGHGGQRDSRGGGSAGSNSPTSPHSLEQEGGMLPRLESQRSLPPDECGLGVTWARNWFRRRQYKHLESVVDAELSPKPVQRGRSTGGRGPSNAGGYSSMNDTDRNGTSPSKVLPKPGPAGHARLDSWDWDQPSPLTDQAYTGDWRRNSGPQRDLSPGRGERRRLLTDSPKQSLLDQCLHCQCCIVM